MKKLGDRHSGLFNDYLEKVETLTEKFSAYFSETEGNLEKLHEFANRLKQDSVDPSFELLATTRDTLYEIKEKIDDISFL
ncbi:MAG: hypothetical protein AAGH67_03650 [Cyanobacteria bacterium P01_H01_bin.162]